MKEPLPHNGNTLLLALTLIPGVGSARLKTLAEAHPDLPSILHQAPSSLARLPGIGEKLATIVHRFLHQANSLQAAIEKAEQQLTLLHRLGGTMVTILDPLYPPLLREIYDPPSCLFIRGTLPPPEALGLAVVGTRYASQYGKKCADLFCKAFAQRGIAVYSGLAYGIDTAAHSATLQHGGQTIAVLAGGVDSAYTDPQGKLWPQIIENGALISEEWIGSELTPAKFPKRNRIISGITSGTLVIESDIKGGSLITARSALEQNREVFAVPGPIFSRGSRGTNSLIAEGAAKAVTSVEELINELGPRFTLTRPGATPETRRPAAPFSAEESALLKAMGEEPIHLDELAQKSGIDYAGLLLLLFDLEMKSAIEQQPGQFFQRTARF
ncbi:DNA-processing protein DprA [Chlorobium phaeovibrioides]|uniref:DNA-protecting protein DprA n=1 Tax=Chlorobium phaeovibrioides TaxID=1094 RepID=A0ABW9UMP8_CHLPH|nr:DNA-processing protein DprA [Chlorobium phaeovibrioides]MWV54348.1 DNA-protecting protein DprA [Chlorobium phaeovibrioides]